MINPAPTSDTPTEAEVVTPEPAVEDLILEDDLLVEDVSIDGMCGVY